MGSSFAISINIVMRGHLLQLAREAAARIVTVRAAGGQYGGSDFRGSFTAGRCPRALPADSRRFWRQFNAYLPVPARAGTTSSCSARRPIQRGVGNTRVPAALKHLLEVDPHPNLNRQPPLSHLQVLFIKEMTGVPTHFSGGRLGRACDLTLERQTLS